jgi:hypothetical protein
MVVGIAGAELGGIAGWSTGGDVRTARSVWRPTVEGNYYITPDHFDGERQFRFSNLEPVIRETNSAIGRDTIATGCDGRACDGTGARSSVHDDYLHPAPAPAQP